MMKLMDKHKNIINLLGVCTQDGEGIVQAGHGHGVGTGDEDSGTLGWDWAGAEQSVCPSQGHCM